MKNKYETTGKTPDDEIANTANDEMLEREVIKEFIKRLPRENQKCDFMIFPISRFMFNFVCRNMLSNTPSFV